MGELVAAFRHAVRCYRLVTEGDGRSGWEYMQAVRRVQAAYGIPLARDNYRASSNDWEKWQRLCAAIHRWGSA